MDYSKLRDKVIYCLEKHPSTRNSDIQLTNSVWVEFFPMYIFGEPGNWSVKLLDIYKLPTEDNIKRIRAKLNQEGQFLATDPEVTKKRRGKEKQWREDLGYQN